MASIISCKRRAEESQLQRLGFRLRTSPENCRCEVAAAEKMMRRAGMEWFDTISRSIEELAVQLMQELKRER